MQYKCFLVYTSKQRNKQMEIIKTISGMIDVVIAVQIMLKLTIIGHILVCLVPAMYAKRRGRNQYLWYIYSLVIGPIMSALCIAILGEKKQLIN